MKINTAEIWCWSWIKEKNEELANYLFEISDLTDKEYKILKSKFKETKIGDINLLNEQLNGDIWQQILHEISREISAPSFDTWFKNTKANFDGDVLKITCSNNFQMEWLKERYYNLISSEAKKKIIGKAFDIQVTNQDEEEKSSIN